MPSPSTFLISKSAAFYPNIHHRTEQKSLVNKGLRFAGKGLVYTGYLGSFVLACGELLVSGAAKLTFLSIRHAFSLSLSTSSTANWMNRRLYYWCWQYAYSKTMIKTSFLALARGLLPKSCLGAIWMDFHLRTSLALKDFHTAVVARFQDRLANSMATELTGQFKAALQPTYQRALATLPSSITASIKAAYRRHLPAMRATLGQQSNSNQDLSQAEFIAALQPVDSALGTTQSAYIQSCITDHDTLDELIGFEQDMLHLKTSIHNSVDQLAQAYIESGYRLFKQLGAWLKQKVVVHTRKEQAQADFITRFFTAQSNAFKALQIGLRNASHPSNQQPLAINPNSRQSELLWDSLINPTLPTAAEQEFLRLMEAAPPVSTSTVAPA